MSVINTASNTVTTTIAVSGSPTGVAITPDDAHAYVTNGGSSTSVIDTATNTVTTTTAVGSTPGGLAIASVTSAPTADLAAAVTDSTPRAPTPWPAT